MADRVNTTDRIGVNAFERIVLKELKWIFREQPTVDVGIDATIERVANNSPTGEQIAVQIKSGLGNVKVNKDGHFDYYLSQVHYQYWLSYPIPVIIVLYDTENEILYWNSIFKRNMPKTHGDKHKITIKKDSILSRKSIDAFENIIRVYQSKSVIDIDFDPTEADELGDYCSDLLTYCSDSIASTRRLAEKLDLVYAEQSLSLQAFIDSHPEGADKKIIDKEIKKTAIKYTLAINIFRTRMSNEIPIMVEAHINALQCANKYLSPQLYIHDFYLIAKGISKVFSNEISSILSTIIVVNDLSKSFRNGEHQWSIDLSRAEQNCATVFDDYVCELSDLVDLLRNCITTIDEISRASADLANADLQL